MIISRSGFDSEKRTTALRVHLANIDALAFFTLTGRARASPSRGGAGFGGLTEQNQHVRNRGEHGLVLLVFFQGVGGFVISSQVAIAYIVPHHMFLCSFFSRKSKVPRMSATFRAQRFLIGVMIPSSINWNNPSFLLWGVIVNFSRSAVRTFSDSTVVRLEISARS